MSITVTLAGDPDVGAAEQLMRQVVERDLGGYRPEWHGDVDDLAGFYLTGERSGLFVARLGDELAGTAAIRPCRLRTPPNPSWLVDRYAVPDVCELRRVWVASWARRRGVAAALVRTAAQWATRSAGFETVYLHTDTSAPGAEAFWRAMPTVEVHDARPDPHNCVHFVLDVDKLCEHHPVSAVSQVDGR